MDVFHIFLVLHIASGTICLLTGLVALTAKKRRGRHTVMGEVYHASYVVLFVAAIVTSIMHWSQDAYLFYIALFSYGLALLGYLARKIRWKNWLSAHIQGMSGSYIGVVTAVLVVNGPHVPVLKHLGIFVWFIPTIVGTPLIARTVARYVPKRKQSRTA